MKDNFKMLSAPIPRLGGKSRLRKQIISLLPDHTCYVEPFFGAGWVYFGKEPSKVEVINDIDGELINLFKMIKYHAEEIQNAIIQGDVQLLKSIKGIGAKSAQRIIVDLRDKVGKTDDNEQIISTLNNTIKDEALSALVMLGFPKAKVDKLINHILKEQKDLTVEDLVKESLKRI